ncbi:MAG: hypothetical protein KGN35_10535, partial [Betaproteobacteria bacterium]|nr:hypothetical protein [Betaproteobacteria bacterium]
MSGRAFYCTIARKVFTIRKLTGPVFSKSREIEVWNSRKLENSAASPVVPGALNILKEVFGYPAFRGQQAEVIEHLASGGDCLVLM